MRVKIIIFEIVIFSRFLHQVHEHSNENKMTADNLALVFGPNILSPEVRTFPDEQISEALFCIVL